MKQAPATITVDRATITAGRAFISEAEGSPTITAITAAITVTMEAITDSTARNCVRQKRAGITA